MINLVCKKNDNVLNYLNNYEGLNYNKVQALFRKKDIKVNGKRVDCKYNVNKDDIITLYANFNTFFDIKVLFEDENIIVLDKPKKLEVISETRDISLLNLVNKDYFVVHRIDFNTEGIVVFAKNEQSKKELDFAFKNGLVQKKYITICKGLLQKDAVEFNDFLIKGDNKVKIVSKKTEGVKTVITGANLIKAKKDYSLLDVNLKTGRTHQIRAHLAFHNLFVLGDDKYGDFKTNKDLNLKSQILKCYLLKFNFDDKSVLNYLNGQTFKADCENVVDYFNSL